MNKINISEEEFEEFYKEFEKHVQESGSMKSALSLYCFNIIEKEELELNEKMNNLVEDSLIGPIAFFITNCTFLTPEIKRVLFKEFIFNDKNRENLVKNVNQVIQQLVEK